MERARGFPTVGAVMVTIEASGHQVQTRLSSERTVAELIPELVTLLFGPDDQDARGRAWGLTLRGGAPLPGPSTLTDLHLSDGCTLLLEEIAPLPSLAFQSPVLLPRGDDLL